jgi:hypothetical protein
MLLIVLLTIALAPGTGWAAEGVGEVVFVKGDAVARDPSGEQPLDLQEPVYEGVTLVTEPGARLAVKMIDGSVITLGSDTEFRIERYRYQAPSKTGEAAMRLLKGAFRAVTGMLGKTPQPSFTVETPVVTLGIRGTDYWAGYGYFTPGKLEAVLIAGKGVYLKNEAGITELNIPGTGSGTTARDQAPSPMVAWPEEKYRRALASVAWE